MWAIPTGTSLPFKKKNQVKSPSIWSRTPNSVRIRQSGRTGTWGVITNVCEVTTKPALLNFAILQDIPFDVGHVIKDTILYNKDDKKNLGHPFLIFGLCKRVEVPLEDNEAWIHPVKAISVKKDKPGLPLLDAMYDSSNEPLDEDEL